MVAPWPEALYFPNSMTRLLTGLIQMYRYTVSPFLSFIGGPGSGCRFTPSCSEFTLQAIEEHGPACGTLLGLRRICRCHPWGGFGFDPVPPKPAHKFTCTSLQPSRNPKLKHL